MYPDHRGEVQQRNSISKARKRIVQVDIYVPKVITRDTLDLSLHKKGVVKALLSRKLKYWVWNKVPRVENHTHSIVYVRSDLNRQEIQQITMYQHISFMFCRDIDQVF